MTQLKNHNMPQVAVLFADQQSVYKTLPNCDVYDKQRNAMNYQDTLPIVAHPPSQAWSYLTHGRPYSFGEKECATFALKKVRSYGGVLVHPYSTQFWQAADLPDVTKIDGYSGYTLVVDQHWWGHPGQKLTRLYVVGVAVQDLPIIPLAPSHVSHSLDRWLSKNHRIAHAVTPMTDDNMPVAFAIWLAQVAQMATRLHDLPTHQSKGKRHAVH